MRWLASPWSILTSWVTTSGCWSKWVNICLLFCICRENIASCQLNTWQQLFFRKTPTFLMSSFTTSLPYSASLETCHSLLHVTYISRTYVPKWHSATISKEYCGQQERKEACFLIILNSSNAIISCSWLWMVLILLHIRRQTYFPDVVLYSKVAFQIFG